jgi:hypothetical protein
VLVGDILATRVQFFRALHDIHSSSDSPFLGVGERIRSSPVCEDEIIENDGRDIYEIGKFY